MSRYFPLFWDWHQKRALFYRIYINVFSIFLGIKLLPLGIYKDSIDFYYKGDTVIFLYPKSRKSGFKWVSMLSEGGFHTLKDLDKFWDRILGV